jgi:hypothetical protein
LTWQIAEALALQDGQKQWSWGRRGNNSSMAERRSKRWTPQEDDRFRRMAEANTRPEVIAAKLDRSVHAIKARAYTIGLPLKWFKLKAKGKNNQSGHQIA